MWREEADLPLGRLGQSGWLVIESLLATGAALWLRRFARFAVRG